MHNESPRSSVPGLEWTLDPRVRHLNHGSFGAVPVAVHVQQQRLRRRMESNPVRWFAGLPEQIGRSRVDMAGLLGVPTETLAFVLNASAGASVIYQRLVDQGPAHVVVTNHGYGAVSMGAHRLARRTGGSYRTIAIPLDADARSVVQLLREAFEQAPVTLLVIDQITSATARAFPVDQLCRLAHDLGAKVLIDGAHAPGVLACPVSTQADWWIGNFHKFGCSPPGSAMIYARDGDLFPLIDSWGAQLPYPERFDHTGTLDVTSWLVTPFAWRYLDQTVGWNQIRQRCSGLADTATRIIAAALAPDVDSPVPQVGMPAGPMRLFRLPAGLGGSREEADALRIPFIDATGIAVAFTSFDGVGYLRISTHLYNSVEDFEYLATVGIPLLRRWSHEKNRGVAHIKEDG